MCLVQSLIKIIENETFYNITVLFNSLYPPCFICLNNYILTSLGFQRLIILSKEDSFLSLLVGKGINMLISY